MKKLYSQSAIAIATYFGGPLAAGILIRKNSINLGREREGLGALIVGIIGTILLLWGIFQIPDTILDKIPNVLLPTIYTSIIFLIVEKMHGKILKKHKEEKHEFYSIWKATGIGLLCAVVLF
jgi:preprotein translocase subunit Sss1